MAKGSIGVAISGRDATNVVELIQHAEDLRIPAAWLTSGGAGMDSLTLFAAAAVRTNSILLGTSIVPTWPRHPLVVVQQAQVLAHLAPERFRLGIGPSHKPSMERTYGFEFVAPLQHLREYLQIVKQLLTEGEVDFDGEYYHAHARVAAPTPLPVMASALRATSFMVCGEEADGAISWVCPGNYLKDVALPAMRKGAESRLRAVPPLIAHAPVCVHDNPEEVMAAAREQIANYPRLPFYAQMLEDAGFPEAKKGEWSEPMLDAVVLSGDENRVASRLQEILDWGAEEIIVSPIGAGNNPAESRERTLRLLGDLSGK